MKDPLAVRESAKKKKYAAKCKEAGVGLGVIVLDVFGGLGTDSKAVIDWCVREAEEKLTSAFLRASLSFAVQRGNMLMTERVFRSLHSGHVPFSDFADDID